MEDAFVVAAAQHGAHGPPLCFSQYPLQAAQVPVKHDSHSGGATVSFFTGAGIVHSDGNGEELQHAWQDSLSSARQATPRRLHGGAYDPLVLASTQHLAQVPSLLVSHGPLQMLQSPVQHDSQSGLPHWSPAGAGLGPGAGAATIRTSPHCCHTCEVCSQS